MSEPSPLAPSYQAEAKAHRGGPALPAGHGRQFPLFLLTGGLAAIINLASRYALTPSMGFEAAVLTAYVIGMVVAYVLFRVLVFGRSGRSIRSEVYRFMVVNAVALALVWVVSVGLARIVFPAVGFTWHGEDIAHVVGVCVPALSSYIGHLRYTFG